MREFRPPLEKLFLSFPIISPLHAFSSFLSFNLLHSAYKILMPEPLKKNFNFFLSSLSLSFGIILHSAKLHNLKCMTTSEANKNQFET